MRIGKEKKIHQAFQAAELKRKRYHPEYFSFLCLFFSTFDTSCKAPVLSVNPSKHLLKLLRYYYRDPQPYATDVSRVQTDSIPLTTEEPIESKQLRNALNDINDVTALDPNVPEAVLLPKPNPNEFPTPAELLQVDGDLASRLQKSGLEVGEAAVLGSMPSGDIEDDDETDSIDPELMEITEKNRYVALDEFAERPPIRSAKSVRKRQCLVFQDPPVVVTQPQRITVTAYYGVLPPDWDAAVTSPLSPDNPSVPMPRIKPPSKSRRYLVACDFSEESFFAIEWTMGTLMRDGDEIHLVTVVNREDNPELVEAAGMTLSKEVCATMVMYMVS
jgi:hypothetical protein